MRRMTGSAPVTRPVVRTMPSAEEVRRALAGRVRAVATVLPFTQSLLIVWPQVVGLLGMTSACFAAAYVAFMRQEVRA